MSHVRHEFESIQPMAESRLLVPAIVVGAALFALIGSQYPVHLLGVLLAGTALYAVAKWPEASTLLFIFILYSNVAAIAVEFHGMPFILGASFFGLLAIPLAHHLFVRKEQLIFPGTACLFMLIAGLRLAAALTAKHPDLALKEVLALAVEGVMLYVLLINVVRTRESLRRAVWAAIAAGIFMSLAPLYQQLTSSYDNPLWGLGQVSDAAFHVDPNSDKGPVQPRLAGSIGEQNRYAQVMLMLVPLALLRIWGESRAQLKVIAGVAACLITTAVILTFSRGAAIGMVAVLMAMAWLQYVRRSSMIAVLVAFACILVAFPQYGTRMAKLGGLWATMDSTAGTADGSLQSRFTEMGAAGLVFLDNPLIGVGTGMFRHHYRDYAERIGLRVIAKGRGSHSLYLGLAAETGALGLMLFASVVVITLRDLFRTYRRAKFNDPALANLAASFILVIVAYLTTAFFLHEAYVRFFWLMMALAYVASHLPNQPARAAAREGQVTT